MISERRTATMQEIVETIAKRIHERGFVQNAVAKKAGMDPHALSQVLCGKRKLQGIELLRLCPILDLNCEDFCRIRKMEGDSNDRRSV